MILCDIIVSIIGMIPHIPLIKAEVHVLFAAFFRFYIVAGRDDGADKFIHVIGFCNREVAEQTGIPMGTVSYYAAAWRKKHKGEKLKKSKKEKQRAESAKESPKVDNSDRHLCKSCKFRSNRPKVNICDYMAITKHSRGCKVEECAKYEKGARMRMKDVEE